MSEEGAVLTPIYNEMIYEYHLCSNCNKKIYLEENMFVPLRFEEKINYCPYCGQQIIRYSHPKYIEKPNFEWLEKYKKIIEKVYRRMEYEIHCQNTEHERKDLIDKAEFGIEYFGNYFRWDDEKTICKMIKEIAMQEKHYSYKNKLKVEFENIINL